MRFTFKTKDYKYDIPVFPGISLDGTYSDVFNRKYRDIYKIDNERTAADGTYNCHGLTFINRLGLIGVLDPKPGLKEIVRTSGRPITSHHDDPDDSIDKILRGNGYNRIGYASNYKLDSITGDHDIKRGDIIIYKDYDSQKNRMTITHSGIIIGIIISIHHGLEDVKSAKISDVKDLIVLSKMGKAGEYYHGYKKIPNEIAGNTIEIWSERK